jgi:imidazolonepropionase
VASGTCAIEIKSGYGLEWPEELKMLRVIHKLKLESSIPIKITYLAAHAIPKKWQTDTDGYVHYIISESIPQIAAQGYADYIDVFCEKGYFTAEQCTRILNCGISFGLKPRLHAEQLSHSGGIALGVKINAVSVDHLEYCSDADIELLTHSKVMPVILPGAAFFLQLPSPPVRKMLQAGLPLVLASDYNPGSSPSGNILEMMRLACITMGMQIEEAFNASTINAACTMQLQNQYGSIWPGKRMHLILTKPHWDLTRMIYEFSSNPIEEIIC